MVPVDPVVAFIDYFHEDYGDEWVTKAMHHYRWFYEADVAKALPVDQGQQMPPERLERATQFITNASRDAWNLSARLRPRFAYWPVN
jgi:hypothetical protein